MRKGCFLGCIHKSKNQKKKTSTVTNGLVVSLSLSIIFNLLLLLLAQAVTPPSLEAPTYSAEWSAGTGSLRKVERCKTNTLGNDQWRGLFKHTNFDSYSRCPTAEHVTSQCFCLSMYCHTRSLAPFLFLLKGNPSISNNFQCTLHSQATKIVHPWISKSFFPTSCPPKLRS